MIGPTLYEQNIGLTLNNINNDLQRRYIPKTNP